MIVGRRVYAWTMSNPLSTPVQEQVKAVVGALLAGLTALGTALADGQVTSVEGVGIAVAVLATYATVFGVTNQSPEPQYDEYFGEDNFYDGHGA